MKKTERLERVAKFWRRQKHFIDGHVFTSRDLTAAILTPKAAYVGEFTDMINNEVEKRGYHLEVFLGGGRGDSSFFFYEQLETWHDLPDDSDAVMFIAQRKDPICATVGIVKPQLVRVFDRLFSKRAVWLGVEIPRRAKAGKEHHDPKAQAKLLL